jgi:hypothetical protein
MLLTCRSFCFFSSYEIKKLKKKKKEREKLNKRPAKQPEQRNPAKSFTYTK